MRGQDELLSGPVLLLGDFEIPPCLKLEGVGHLGPSPAAPAC